MATRGKVAVVEMPATEAAYLAGLFDGEGHFSLVIIKKSLTAKGVIPFYMRASCQMASTSKELCDLLQRWFGGNTYPMRANHEDPSRKAAWDWRTFDVRAASAAATLLPYLRLKQENAQVIVDFYTKRTNGLGRIPLPLLEAQRRVDLLYRLRALTGSGRPIDMLKVDAFLDCYRPQRLSEEAVS